MSSSQDRIVKRVIEEFVRRAGGVSSTEDRLTKRVIEEFETPDATATDPTPKVEPEVVPPAAPIEEIGVEEITNPVAVHVTVTNIIDGHTSSMPPAVLVCGKEKCVMSSHAHHAAPDAHASHDAPAKPAADHLPPAAPVTRAAPPAAHSHHVEKNGWSWGWLRYLAAALIVLAFVVLAAFAVKKAWVILMDDGETKVSSNTTTTNVTNNGAGAVDIEARRRISSVEGKINQVIEPRLRELVAGDGVPSPPIQNLNVQGGGNAFSSFEECYNYIVPSFLASVDAVLIKDDDAARSAAGAWCRTEMRIVQSAPRSSAAKGKDFKYDPGHGY